MKKRLVKISLIAVASLVGAVLLAGSIAAGVLLSPKRLTPLVNNVANRYVNGEIRVEKVELTFFSTFPHIGLELENGTVVSHVLRDSAFKKSDTVLGFNACRFSLDYKTWKNEKRLRFRSVKLDSLHCYLYTSADSLRNYMLFAAGGDTASKVAAVPAIEAEKLEIVNADLRIRNKMNRFRFRTVHLNLKGNASYDSACIRACVNLNTERLSLSKDSTRFLRRVPLNLSLQGAFNHRTLCGGLDTAYLAIDKLRIGLKGGLQTDSLSGDMRLNLTAALQTKSLQELLSMIPPKILAVEGVEADGAVNLRAKVYGGCNHGKKPQIRLDLTLDNGRAKFEGVPYPIDTVNTTLNAYLDLAGDTASFAALKNLKVVAQDINISGDAGVENLLSDPDINFELSTRLDLSGVSKIVPLRTGISMGGKVKFDLEGNFRWKDIQNADYGKITAKGGFDLEKVYYDDSLSHVHVEADADGRLRDGKYLGGIFHFHRMKASMPSVRAYVDSLDVVALSGKPGVVHGGKGGKAGASSVVRTGVFISYSRLFASVNDSIRLFSMRSKIRAQAAPDAVYPDKAAFSVDFRTDSLYARMGSYRVLLNRGKLGLDLLPARIPGRKWHHVLEADSIRASVILPQLSEPLQVRRFKARIDGPDLEIEKARFRLGDSRLNVKGKVRDIHQVLQPGFPVKAEITLKSRMIDCNQLLNILTEKADEQQLEKEAGRQLNAGGDNDEAADDYKAETLQSVHLFVIPDNFDIRVETDVKKLFYDRMRFDSIKGKMRVRNQTVNLRELSMKGWGARITLNAVYAGRNREQADVGADLKLESIYVDSLIRSFPELDTTMPMLRYFKGIVDLEAKASGSLDSNVRIRLPGLTAALHLRGNGLSLLDNKTYVTVAKLLNFKSKERISIDSISTTVMVQDGLITVYPFKVSVDRYELALGGRQDMNMNYRYHISVLKTPALSLLNMGLMPDGITISGNFTDGGEPSIKPAEALYKNSFTPMRVQQIDSARLDLGQQIVRQFEGWMNREHRRLRRVDGPKTALSEGDSVR